MSTSGDQPLTRKRLGTAKRPASAIGRAGLHGAPAQPHQVASPTGSRAHELASAPPRPVQYTLRLSYDESDSLAALVRTLRRRRGEHIDQSTVLRALIALAADPDNPQLADALAQHIAQ